MPNVERVCQSVPLLTPCGTVAQFRSRKPQFAADFWAFRLGMPVAPGSSMTFSVRSAHGPLAGLAAALSLFSMSDAHACGATPNPVVELADTEVPTDGLVLGLLKCDACTTADIAFRGADGNEIEGEFQTLPTELSSAFESRLFAWKPTTSFSAGEHVAVVSAVPGFESAAVRTIPASTAAPVAEAALTRHGRGIDAVKCKAVWSTGGLCQSPVFYEKTAHEARLALTVSGSNAGQYVYRVTFNVEGTAGSTEFFHSAKELSHVFEGTPDAVCYSLIAEPVAEGANSIDFGTHCLDTSELGELGVVDEVSGDPSDVLSQCGEPPEGYEDAWCTEFEDDIAQGTCTSGPCEAARAACSSDSDVDPEPDTTSPQDTAEGPEPSGKSDGGCSVSGPLVAAPSQLVGAGFALMASLYLARRRSIAQQRMRR
jgi:hypothetical protein